MKRSTSGPICALLLGASLLTVGCGSSRQFQSVTVSPASANAQDFANGQVPFAATGTFNKPPSPEPLSGNDVTWCVAASDGVCPGNINRGATVDSNGIAKCAPNFSGTATILAGKAKASMNPDRGATMSVFGKAQLTCP